MSKLQSIIIWIFIGFVVGGFFGELFYQFQTWAFAGVLIGAVFGYFLGQDY